MIQAGSRPGFAPEAFQRLRILRYVRWEKLEGDKAAKLRIFSLVHNAHASAPQLLEHAVMGDGLTNHDTYPSPRCSPGNERQRQGLL